MEKNLKLRKWLTLCALEDRARRGQATSVIYKED